MGLFKSIKKRFKKLGSSIAKRMRKIGRGVKKGFSKITKAFGKLGPLGQLALFFILPGMGSVLGSWMGQFGSKVMNMLPSNFAATLTKIGTKIKAGASFAYENTIGRVYNTVSKALTGGIDAVTKPFMGPGSEGLATSFKNFVSDTATKLSPTPSVELNLPNKLPEATPGVFDKDYKLPTKSTPGVFDKDYKLPEGDFPKGTTDTSKLLEMEKDTKSIFRKGVDKYSKFKTDIGDANVLGTGVEVREVASVTKDATGVFSAYKYFNPDNVEGSFYNPNIGMANQLNKPNDPYTMGGSDATFIPMNASSNMNNSANVYAGIFGNPGPDPISTAIGAPGYGLSYGDYATGGTYG